MDFGNLAQILSPISVGSILLIYMRSLKQDINKMDNKVDNVKTDLELLKNGCFERHAKIERELGRAEAFKSINS